MYRPTKKFLSTPVVTPNEFIHVLLHTLIIGFLYGLKGYYTLHMFTRIYVIVWQYGEVRLVYILIVF